MSILSKGLVAAVAVFVLQGCAVVPMGPPSPPRTVYVQQGVVQATTPSGYVSRELEESSCPRGTVTYRPNIKTASATEVRNYNGYISYMSSNGGQRYDVCLSPEQLREVKAGKSLQDIMVPAPVSVQPVPVYRQQRGLVQDSYGLELRYKVPHRPKGKPRYYYNPRYGRIYKEGGHHADLWQDRYNRENRYYR